MRRLRKKTITQHLAEGRRNQKPYRSKMLHSLDLGTFLEECQETEDGDLPRGSSKKRYFLLEKGRKEFDLKKCHPNVMLFYYVSSMVEFSYSQEGMAASKMILRMLSEPERKTLYLLYWENKPLNEIAKELSLSPSYISRKRKSGLKKIGDFFLNGNYFFFSKLYKRLDVKGDKMPLLNSEEQSC